MRVALLSVVISLLAAFAAAAADQKAIVVSYPDDTPSSVMDAAKDEIKKAGGKITHEYSIIKGFAATAPEKIFKTIKTLDNKFEALIEEDDVVTTQD